MGPQLFSRGDLSGSGSIQNLVGSLQWGHSFSAVEIENQGNFNFTYNMLQWGHSFSAVEISVSYLVPDNS